MNKLSCNPLVVGKQLTKSQLISWLSVLFILISATTSYAESNNNYKEGTHQDGVQLKILNTTLPKANFKDIYNSSPTHTTGKPIKPLKRPYKKPKGWLEVSIKAIECHPNKNTTNTNTNIHIACADMNAKTIFDKKFNIKAGNTKTISSTTTTPYIQTVPKITFEAGKYTLTPKTTRQAITISNKVTISTSRIIQNSLAYSIKLNFEELQLSEDTIFLEDEVYINPTPTINKRILVADGILKLNKAEVISGKTWINIGNNKTIQEIPKNQHLWLEITAKQ